MDLIGAYNLVKSPTSEGRLRTSPRMSRMSLKMSKIKQAKARRRLLWFGLVGALVIDGRNLSRDGDSDCVHVHRVYRTFFLADGTLNLMSI
jgi:hypothetical protein